MKIPPFQIENYIQKIAAAKIAGCLIFGPESSLVNFRFDIVAKKIVPDLSDPFLVSHLSKERMAEDKAILADEFFSLSMLGGRKLILIKDCDVACGMALKLLFEDNNFAQKSKNFPVDAQRDNNFPVDAQRDNNFILIQAGDLDKSSLLRKLAEENPHFAAIACYEDDERVIKKFIADELSKRKIKFDAQTTLMLFEKFGKNRQLILSELEKILIFLGEEKNLTAEIVEKLTASEAEISANEFVMNFAAQKFDAALFAAEKLLRDGFEAITLLRFLSNYLQKIYQARMEMDFAFVDFETAIKNQRLFFKTEIEFRKNLKNLSRQFLIKILRDLEELEIKIKSGNMPPKLLFVGFVTSLTKRLYK